MSRSIDFEHTVRAYSADLYRYAYWLSRDRFQAEDLVQETFERAWKSWSGLRETGSIKAWLVTILRNESARRFAMLRGVATEELPDENLLPPIPPLDGAVEARDMIGKLPITYREPLMLQSLGGFGCREIGEMLGISEGAVMTRLTRARQALRAALRGAEGLARRRMSP